MPALLTNVRIYLAIAEEAAAESKRLAEGARTRRSDGGWVTAFDPDRRSFKHSLIAVAFAGIYLEALLGLVARERLPEHRLKKFDRSTYEEKLKLLGMSDPDLLGRCKRFRLARNDLIHEKVVDLDSAAHVPLRKGQEEAEFALDVVRSITSLLRREQAVGAGSARTRPPRPERR
jgi:hypothetical protein